ncbi:MAG: lmo0937 family membrane protein, partial [Pedobacter sp.]
IAVILVIIWLIGFVFQGFDYGNSNLIHALLVIAIIAILLKVINRAS